MRTVYALFLLLLFACGGSLSSEQRKKIRDNMEAGSLKKITDVELTEAALSYGRSLTRLVEKKDKSLTNRAFLDSLENSMHVEIFFMTPSDSFLRGVEKQIIDAYTSGGALGEIGDNLQKMGPDSLLYTKPLLTERPDGSVEFLKAFAIRIPKKQVVLSIKR